MFMSLSVLSQLHIYMCKHVLVKNYHYGNDLPERIRSVHNFKLFLSRLLNIYFKL